MQIKDEFKDRIFITFFRLIDSLGNRVNQLCINELPQNLLTNDWAEYCLDQNPYFTTCIKFVS